MLVLRALLSGARKRFCFEAPASARFQRLAAPTLSTRRPLRGPSPARLRELLLNQNRFALS